MTPPLAPAPAPRRARWPWVAFGGTVLAAVLVWVLAVVLLLRGDAEPPVALDPEMVTQQPIDDGAAEAWSVELAEGSEVSQVAQVGALVLVTSAADDLGVSDVDVEPSVVAYDESGEEVWRQEAVDDIESSTDPFLVATPTADGEGVLVSDGEQLRLLDAEDGSTQWTLDAEVRELRQFGDRLVVGRSEPDSGVDEENTDEDYITGEVSSIDVASGEVVDTMRGRLEAFGSDGALVTDTTGDQLVLVEPSLEVRWGQDLPGRSLDEGAYGEDAVAAGDEVVLVRVRDDGYGEIVSSMAALDAATGEELWTEEEGWDPVGRAPDGTTAAYRSAGDRVGGGQLLLVGADGEEEALDLPGVEEDALTERDFDPWDGPEVEEATFHDVEGVGLVYVQGISGTTVGPDLDVVQHDSVVKALSTDGVYRFDGDRLVLDSWTGEELAAVEVEGEPERVFALDGAVVTTELATATVRLYR